MALAGIGCRSDIRPADWLSARNACRADSFGSGNALVRQMNFLLKLKGYAIAALAAIGAVLFALVYGFTKGSKSGANAVVAKATSVVLKATQDRNQIEAQVAKQPEGQSAKILKGKWARD